MNLVEAFHLKWNQSEPGVGIWYELTRILDDVILWANINYVIVYISYEYIYISY